MRVSLKLTQKKRESVRGLGQGAAASGGLGWEGTTLATKKRLTCLTRLGNREEGDPNDQALMLLTERKFR